MRSFLLLEKYKLMYHSFLEIGEEFSHGKDYVEQLVRLLPENLRTLYSLKHPDETDLLYKFAAPYAGLKDSGVALGGPQIIPLRALYQAMDFANQFLSPSQILAFLDKLGNPQKHLEQVFEFRPLMYLHKETKPQYELPGADPKTIDWTIVRLQMSYLIEVKVRHSTVISNFNKIIGRNGDISVDIGMPETNPDKLLKEVEGKFVIRRDLSTIGIVWIFSSSAENRSVLTEYFSSKIHPEKIQAIILSGWERDASLICREDSTRSDLVDLFNIVETSKYLY